METPWLADAASGMHGEVPHCRSFRKNRKLSPQMATRALGRRTRDRETFARPMDERNADRGRFKS